MRSGTELSQLLRIFLPTHALILDFFIVADKAACHTPTKVVCFFFFFKCRYGTNFADFGGDFRKYTVRLTSQTLNTPQRH